MNTLRNIALLEAVAADDYDITDTLLKTGADANCKDDNGQPVLVIATKHNNLGIVSLLLNAGANPLVIDNFDHILRYKVGSNVYNLVNAYIAKIKYKTHKGDFNITQSDTIDFDGRVL